MRPAPAAHPAPAARPASRAPPAPSAYVEPGTSRAFAAAPPDAPRAAAPARASQAARAPRALAAERAAGAAAATHRVHADRAPRAPTAATGAAASYAEHSREQQPRSMPSLEALDEQLLYAGDEEVSPRVKLALAAQLHSSLAALGYSSREEIEAHLLQQEAMDDTPYSEQEASQLAVLTATLPIVTQRPRRPRYTSDSDSDSEYKRQRMETAASESSLSVQMAKDDQEQDRASGQASPVPTYADRAKAAPYPQPPAAPPGRPAQPTQTPSRPRYPPLIVESLPNWAHHFKTMKTHLGRAPNARPFGKGVKFTPKEDQEFRYIQKYLTTLEKSEKISWFSYSLPAERSIKVAIRGIPADTNPVDIEEDLREQGFDPEYVRAIRARRGRPGCIFLATLHRSSKTIPDIYKVQEILCMPGVTIEAWRGKKGPAQCHKCQTFRHSSHNCHRQQACVRCGEEHSAHECPRPITEPATCANCGGAHPANYTQCPVFRKEARNKRAGTIAATATFTVTNRHQHAEVDQPNTAAPQQGCHIRTPANEPRVRGAEHKKHPRGRGGKRRNKRKPAKPQPQPEPNTSAPAVSSQTGRRERQQGKVDDSTTEQTIEILMEVLQAVRAGLDPTPTILRGLASIVSSSARQASKKEER